MQAISNKPLNARLALGTVQFGLEYGIANQSGRVSQQEAKSILSEAHACGMNTLDTAIAYGESEKVLGSIGVDGWRIVSKLPAIPEQIEDVAGWVQQQARGSLDRLGVRRLYGLLLHRPDQLLGAKGEALHKGLQQLKAQGWVEKIGVSIYAPEELEQLQNAIELEIVQAPLNVLDRRMIDSGWAARLKQQGGELHVRSAFLQGLLLMGAGERPKKFDRWLPLWQSWESWLEQQGLTPLEACIRFTLSVQEAERVVIGVDQANQLRQIVTAAEGGLPPLPVELRSNDLDLINPARWSQL
jgi:hypothetical protein